MSHDIVRSDATRLAEMIRAREVSPVEVVRAHLDRIEAVNPRINAIVTVAGDALEAAKAAEAAVLAGDELGPLHGVPFTAKDSIDTAGVMTQRGSPIFRGRIPEADATSVARLKAAGAILLAKTNLPEFSYWIESDNLLTGRSNNPWALDRTPGGSSGGESAAIAAGMSPLGLGTDLAISVRGPAAQTGIVGLKATHGRVPMTGIWPRAPRRFWHVGPMARTSATSPWPTRSRRAGRPDAFATSTVPFDAGVGHSPDRPLRVGWLVEPGFGPIDPEVAATVQAAAEASGHRCVVEPVRIPALERDFAVNVFNRLHVMEMKPVFAETTAGHGPDEIYAMARTMLGLPDTPMNDYIEAEQAAERLRDGFAAYFRKYDALVTPVLPVPAHKHGITELTVNGKTVDLTYLQGATVPLNITGLPGLSMRFGTSKEGLPIDVQLVGSWLAESTILHLASLLEAVSPVHDLHPNISCTVSREWLAGGNLLLERPGGVEPLDRLGHGPVEVVDELQDPPPEVFQRHETRPAQQLADQGAEPDLHLVQPRAVLRRVHEPDPMAGVRQELRPALLRLQHSLLLLLPQVVLDPARLGHVPHQALRLVRVQVVHDEHPARQRVGRHRLLDVRREVRLGPRRPQRRGDDAAAPDLQVGRQAQRPVADVLVLPPWTRPGPIGMSGCFRSRAWMPVFSSVLTTWMPCSASCPARSYRSQTASACSRKSSGSSGSALSQ